MLLMFVGAAAPANGATTFTDAGLFETATGGTTILDDYNDFTTGTTDLTTVTDRGDYLIRELTGSLAGDSGAGRLNIDGTGYLLFGSVNVSISFEFDTPIAAVGFEYRNDETFVDLSLTSGGFSTMFDASTTPQFFGVIFDAPVTSFELSSQSPDFLTGIDNLRTTAQLNPIPEPTSMSLAMVGIGTLLLRRRGRARTHRA